MVRVKADRDESIVECSGGCAMFARIGIECTEGRRTKGESAVIVCRLERVQRGVRSVDSVWTDPNVSGSTKADTCGAGFTAYVVVVVYE